MLAFAIGNVCLGQRTKMPQKIGSIDEKWWLLLLDFMAIYSCPFFSTSTKRTSKNSHRLKYGTDEKERKREGKKLLTKKKMSIDLKRSRTKNVQCHRTNSNCFILTQLDTKPNDDFCFSSVIGMHWFLEPSTVSWRWCFYLWFVFIVDVSIPFHFIPFVIFFNAKYRIFLNQNQLTAVFVSNTFTETIIIHINPESMLWF